jgi:hypothetical protein
MDEFWGLTPGMFKALCQRRNIRITYERYANSLTAAAVYNVNRGSSEAPVIHAFDFVRDDKSSAKLERIREAKRTIRQEIGEMPMGTTTRAQLLVIRRKMISNLAARGFDNPEALFNEVWDHLRPTEAEKKEGY